MNKDLKEKWVAALRSGKYKQGKRNLRRGDYYCCLGILCDIIDPTQWRLFDENTKYAYGNNHSTALLPTTTLIKTDIYSINPTVHLPGESEDITLAKLNDSGYTFEQIADLIEAQL
jgi:hypothetical protein